MADAKDFLFEIGTEEMPSAPLNNAVKQLGTMIAKGLDEAGLAHGEVRVISSPRRLAALVACGQRCGARAPGHHAGNAAWRHLGRAFQPLGEWPADGAGGRVGAAIAAGRACGPCGPVYLLVFELRQHRFSGWHGDVGGRGQPVGGGGGAYADGV